MSLIQHRQQEYLGGIVYLLTIDMSSITGNPEHVKRYVNSYGENGEGVEYQGITFQPYPYKLASVKRNQKANTSGSKILIGDNVDLEITRFKDEVGGSFQGGRIYEYKVYGKFLDNGDTPNILAYVKRLDHLVNYVEDSDTRGEIIIHTIDPLSRDITVPTLTFSAGEANSEDSYINVFPAVDRTITQGRT